MYIVCLPFQLHTTILPPSLPPSFPSSPSLPPSPPSLPPSLPSLSWDDILVSAPVYSEPFRHELGRVIVYLNNKVIDINDT